MAKRPTLVTVDTGFLSNTQINQNYTNIETAFDNTLSLDGSTPNAMNANLDMNGFAILNSGNIDASEITVNGLPISESAVAASASAAEASAIRAETFSNGFYNDRSAIVSGNPTAQVVHTGAYDSSVNTYTGGATYRKTTDSTLYASFPTRAKIMTSEGTMYLLSENPVYLDQLGAVGDMTATLGGSGYELNTGTDDSDALSDMDTYCFLTGSQGIIRQNIYVQGQVNLLTHITGVGHYDATIWSDFSELEVAFSPVGSDASLSNVKVIGQYNTTSKPSDRGELGCIYKAGDYLTTEAQTVRRNVGCDILVCRAADIGTQDSYPSPLVYAIGFVEDSHFKVGMFGSSNVTSNTLFSSHWGAHKATTPNAAIINNESYETYHPVNISVEFTTEVYDVDTGYFTSAVGSFTSGPIYCRGTNYGYRFLVGDEADAYVTPSQAGLINKNIRIGHVTGVGCTTPASDGFVKFTGRGTSKWETYPGQAIALIRQPEIDVKVDGVAAVGNGANTARGVRVFGCYGHLDLGHLSLNGFTGYSLHMSRSTDLTGSAIVEGDDPILYETSSGYSIESRIKMASLTNDTFTFGVGGIVTADAPLASTATISTTTTADAAHNATTLLINAITDINGKSEVARGDIIKIDDSGNVMYTKSTAMHENGVTTLTVEPLPQAVTSGATVTVIKSSRLTKATLAHSGSEMGMHVTGESSVDYLTMPGVSNTGRYALRLGERCRANVFGSPPASFGSSDDNMCLMELDSKLVWQGGFFPPAITGAFYFQIDRDGTSSNAHLTLIGATVNDEADLIQSKSGTNIRATYVGVTDEDGTLVTY